METAMKTITFSGYEWVVRKGKGDPGSNTWDDANAQIDDKDRLHLQLTKNKTATGEIEWHCVELNTQQRFGLGRYQFQVIGRIDKLDRNVVLGLFKYPTADVLKDGPNEIDIEFARWGDQTTKNNADYVVLPAVGKRAPNDRIFFEVALNGDYTTHRFLWECHQVTFLSLHGHRDDDVGEFEHWKYTPGQPRLIPQQPTPVHINLWLYQGKAPCDDTPVEIIINKFSFTPLQELEQFD
jgi:hypothetical protein